MLRGTEGTGKGTFVNYIGEIFGSHYLHITNPQQLTGRFNTHLKSCILCFCDEGFWAGDKAAEGVLKGLITEDTLMIEPKGKDVFTIQNHVNLIIASNNDWVVPAGREARRFVVMDIADSNRVDTEYFAAIRNEMDNGGIEAMLYDLLHLDLSKVNLRKAPRTTALFDQVLRSMCPTHKYWYERLNVDTLPHDMDIHGGIDGSHWEGFVESELLYRHYLQFCQDTKARYPAAKSVFVRELREVCPSLENKKRQRDHRRAMACRYHPSTQAATSSLKR